MWLYEQEPIKVSYQSPMFGDLKHCGNEDIMVLVCHVILQDHRAMWLYGQEPIIIILLSLVAIDIVLVKI